MLILVPFNWKAPVVVLMLPEAVMVPELTEMLPELTVRVPDVMVSPPLATVSPVKPLRAPPLDSMAVGVLMKLV